MRPLYFVGPAALEREMAENPGAVIIVLTPEEQAEVRAKCGLDISEYAGFLEFGQSSTYEFRMRLLDAIEAWDDRVNRLPKLLPPHTEETG